MDITAGVKLKEWTWWKIGGPADFFCTPRTVDELREAVHFAAARGLPITVLGGGTNVLVSDQGVEGLVVAMKFFSGTDVKEEAGRVMVTAMAGTPKSELTKIFLKRKLAPALFLCGLPGDVGGGVVMNAGVAERVRPREFVELVDWVEWIDLSSAGAPLRRASRDDLEWKYRGSLGWQPGIIVRVGVSWDQVADEEMPRKVKEATRTRVARQPLDLPSCGSTFKNPEGGFAGALIEQAGLKGYRRGDAMVSPKHANFIVNVGSATAADVRAVMGHVHAEVLSRFGIALETEVRLLGRWV